MTAPTTEPSPPPTGVSRDPRGPSPHRRIGDYQIVADLGAGGMGAVYRVRHVQTGATYALKMIRPIFGEIDEEDLIRFEREAQVLARLDAHPNLVRVFSLGRSDEGPYCVMELVEGKTLGAHIAERGRIEPRGAARVLAEVARAIAHVHAQGVTHRDLKPDNVIIDATSGLARVLDFGLALDATRLTRVTQGDVMIGTPAYMAPEQVDPTFAGAEPGPATDVHALGAILFALVTGEPPWSRSDGPALLQDILTARAPRMRSRVADAPEELDAIAERALEKRPADRYGSAAELADDLERWLEGRPIEARATGSVTRLFLIALPRGARRSIAFGAVALLAVGLVVAVILSSVLRSRAAHTAALRAAQDDLDALHAAVTSTDLSPADLERFAELPAIVAALERLDGRDSKSATTIETIELLAPLASGEPLDPATVATVLHRWQGHREVALRVLLVAGRHRDAAELLERDDYTPPMVITRVLAEAVIDGRIPTPGAKVTRLLVDALSAGGDAADSQRVQDLRGRRVEVIVDELRAGAFEIRTRREEIDELTREMFARAWRTGERPRLDPEALETLADHALALLAGEDALEEANERLIEAALLALPPDDPRLAEIPRSFVGHVLASGTGRARERAATVGLLLVRAGIFPGGASELRLLGLPEASLRARVEAEVRRGLDGLDPAALAAPLAALLEKRGETSDESVWTETLAAFLVEDETWSRIRLLLARERARGDCPGWVLSWIAEILADASTTADPDRREQIAGQARTAWSAGRAAGSVEQVIDELHALAFERDGLQVGRHRLKIAYEYAEWIRRQEANREPSAGSIAVLLEALRRAGALQDARAEAYLHADALKRTGQLSEITFGVVEPRNQVHCTQEPGRGADCPATALAERVGRLIDRGDPISPRGYELRASELTRHQEHELALAHIDEAAGSGRDGDRLVHVLLLQVDVLIAMGRESDARAALERVPTPHRLIDPIARRARLRLGFGDLEGAAADWELAASRWDARLAPQPRPAGQDLRRRRDVLLEAADARERLGDDERAAELRARAAAAPGSR